MKKLLKHPATQALVARLVAGYCALALRTTRWTLDGADLVDVHIKGAPAVVVFWHENLPMLPVVPRLLRRVPGHRPLPVHALVSQHRDGRLIGYVLRTFRIEPVFGSSSRGGAASMRSMLNLLSSGRHVAITPDGPRGPRHKADAGLAQLAAVAGVPVVPCAAWTSLRITLGSWDRMRIPLPFGRGVLAFGAPIVVPRDGWRDAVPGLEAAMNQALERAEMLCRG